MERFKGTKGNWYNIETPSHPHPKVICRGISICNITTNNYTEAFANAELISKAPELLEKLIYLTELINVMSQELTKEGIEKVKEIEGLIAYLLD